MSMVDTLCDARPQSDSASSTSPKCHSLLVVTGNKNADDSTRAKTAFQVQLLIWCAYSGVGILFVHEDVGTIRAGSISSRKNDNL